MRILGFSKKWGKLRYEKFTTFRFPRKDKDWFVGEVVQVVFNPRRKGGGGHMGTAEIVGKELRDLFRVGLSDTEIINDGFRDKYEMGEWLDKTYGRRWLDEPMNKLTLRWLR